MARGRPRARLILILLGTTGGIYLGPPAIGDEPARPLSRDLTFRPTVIVLRGKSQGSGTIVASVAGETLVLTAAHVLDSNDQVFVELHRQNLGLERRGSAEGWPKKIAAQVVALDRATDLAVLKVGGLAAMPFVARLDLGEGEPKPGTVVVSIGIDRGTNFASWGTRIVDVARVDIKRGGGARQFLLTEKTPEHGRSGGPLFLTDGTVVGVCTGKAEVVNGRRIGVFASSQSIRNILRQNDLEAAVARSSALRAPVATSARRGSGTVPAPPPAGPPR
jgi:S1-C subfamily serine protease